MHVQMRESGPLNFHQIQLDAESQNSSAYQAPNRAVSLIQSSANSQSSMAGLSMASISLGYESDDHRNRLGSDD